MLTLIPVIILQSCLSSFANVGFCSDFYVAFTANVLATVIGKTVNKEDFLQRFELLPEKCNGIQAGPLNHKKRSIYLFVF